MPDRQRTRLTRTTRRLVATLSAVVAVASIGAATATAVPGPNGSPSVKPVDPKLHHRISSVNAALDRLSRHNEQLDEQYNVAGEAVTAAKKSARQARQAADRAKARFRAAHAQFVMALTEQYENGPTASAGELLTSGSPQQYLDGLTLAGYLTGQFAATMDAQKAARVDAARATHEAAATLAAARRKEAALAARRAELQRQAHRFQQLLDTLTAQQRSERAAAEAVAAAKARAQLTPRNKVKAATNAPPAHHAHHAPASPAPPVSTGPISAKVQRVIAFAEAQIGKSYSYGGSGPSAYDCSGLTMTSWAQVGVHLPHSAAGQYSYGTHVAYSDLQPGDLIFLYSPIGHVELYVGHDLAVSAADPSIGIVYVHPSDDMGNYTGATRLVG